MRTFTVKNGDIELGGEISGPLKIAQDLKHRLINDLGYNRFHPWAGASLDDFVGRIPRPTVLAAIKTRVREQLDLYLAQQRELLRQRRDLYQDGVVAATLLGADSLVRRWEDVDVYEDGGEIAVDITFTTIGLLSGQTSLRLDTYASSGPLDALYTQYLSREGEFALSSALANDYTEPDRSLI